MAWINGEASIHLELYLSIMVIATRPVESAVFVSVKPAARLLGSEAEDGRDAQRVQI